MNMVMQKWEAVNVFLFQMDYNVSDNQKCI